MPVDPLTFSIAALLATEAAKQGVKLIVNRLASKSEDSAKKALSQLNSKAKIDSLYRKMRHVRQVKTIWQLDKEIDLAEFYHPTKVIIDDQSRVVKDLLDLGSHPGIVLQGTAGQGKSILMRYLTSREMVRGSVLPIFCELRRLRGGKTIQQLVLTELKNLGFPNDDSFFDWLAREGQALLLLDAFDEIPDDEREQIIFELEDLRKRYDNLQIVISSRPESDIGNCPLFRVLRLALLEDGDYQSVIARITGEPKLSGEIIEGVEAHAIKELLTTPLMVALLVIRYKIEQTIPESAVSFYENLFPLLLQRHDKTKPGFIRPRKSGISDSRIESVFNSLSFVSANSVGVAIPETKMGDIVGQASSTVGEEIDTSHFVDDVCKITCLLLHDGGEYRFIHKSVQEYHAALFIKTQPDAVAEAFYESVSASRERRDETWHEVLKFLCAIDNYRYLKYFESKIIRRFLNVSADWASGTLPSNLDEMITTILKRVAIGIPKDENKKTGFTSVLIDDWVTVTCEKEQDGIFHSASRIQWHKLRTECLQGSAPESICDRSHWTPHFSGDKEYLWSGLASNWLENKQGESVRNVGEGYVKAILRRLERAESTVRSIEGRKTAVILANREVPKALGVRRK